MESWFLYVPLASVARRLAEGWAIADDFATIHHGRHAVLMRWAGAGAPPGAPDD